MFLAYQFKRVLSAVPIAQSKHPDRTLVKFCIYHVIEANIYVVFQQKIVYYPVVATHDKQSEDVRCSVPVANAIGRLRHSLGYQIESRGSAYVRR